MKRLLKILLWVAAAGVVLVAGLNVYVLALGGSGIRQADDVPAVDAIIVPGAMVWGSRVSFLLADRLDTAVALYQAGVAPKILVSGDHGRTEYDEVNVMRRYLMDAGIPGEDIFMDHAGFDSYNTLYRAKHIFGVSSCVVATNRYHLYRCLYMGRRMGITTYGVACTGYIPAKILWYQVREVAARCKAVLWTEILRPDVTYGGPVIPIQGDGHATWDKED